MSRRAGARKLYLLPARVQGQAEQPGDVLVGSAEHVVQHERGSGTGRKCVQHGQELRPHTLGRMGLQGTARGWEIGVHAYQTFQGTAL